MATSFNLGGLLGLGGNELDDLLSPEQRSAIQQRGLLSAAAALLQAGGPSTRRVSLGQALGSALEAGQTGAQAAQQSALTQMLTRQKLEEARQESEANRGFRSALESMRGGGAADAMTPAQALAMPGLPAGPTVERAGMIGQAAPAGMGAPGARVLTDAQIELFKTLPRKEAAAEILKLTQPPARSEKAKLLDEIGLPVTIENLRLLEKPEADPENLRMLRALGLPVTLESLRSLQKPGEEPEGVRTLRALNMPVTLENLRSLQKPEADPESVRMLRALNLPVTLENLRSLQKPEAEPEGVKTLRALNLPVTLENLRSLQKPGEEPEGVKTLRALNLPVTMENLRNLQKPETDPEGVRTLRALNLPVTMENLRNLQRPEADPESVKMLRALNLPVTLENLRSIQRPEAEPEGVRTLRALNLPVTMENLRALQRPEATPSEIRVLEATGTPVTLQNIMRLRQSGAASTTVDVRMPGNQQFLAGVGGDVSKTLGDLTQAARAATDTLATIERIRPVISEAVVGPAADYRTTMLRIGQQLGVAGQSETERLANTRTLVQGLAQMELDAAAGMRGQGALTEGERGILRRAAAGDQTLSAAELRSALSAAEKVANRRIQTQKQYLESARKLPGFEQFAPLYQVVPPSGGSAPNLLNSIDAELQRRQQQTQPPRGR